MGPWKDERIGRIAVLLLHFTKALQPLSFVYWLVISALRTLITLL
jgi:hypothetical protein